MFESVGAACFTVLIAALVVGAIWLIPWADRRRVCRMIEQAGGDIIHIRRIRPPLRMLLSERTTDFWRVYYVDRNGDKHVADCFASFLRCKIYKDEVVRRQ